VFNAQQIPYPNEYFDVIIANLMLYHVPDRKKAFSEIYRVLKSDGRFYATTFGKSNMKEINEMVSSYDSRLDNPLELFAMEFGLENGESQLKQYFDEVEMKRYHDSLIITEVDPIVKYVLSFGKNKEILVNENLRCFREYITEILDNNEKIMVTKDTGIFIAKKH
jgi:ubiquinone/menaquinone biosynthesis C-methylase UbiE